MTRKDWKFSGFGVSESYLSQRSKEMESKMKNMFEERAARFRQELLREDLSENQKELLLVSLSRLERASKRRAVSLNRKAKADSVVTPSSSEGDC
eukprot:CAMPEP_0182450124 /NCGR_PEP_ID=MMETSP1172-20130603/39047_1 /TAXON_ID=708627 /ORGANISM="Timspurckia oligopyrenoides, Strain CCMP3278" /LENGTH=94 /DNA_ID=CAMNT_0024647627 /DNA_START=27 /DNA_END=311 /DNA_ORIENTATION=-